MPYTDRSITLLLTCSPTAAPALGPAAPRHAPQEPSRTTHPRVYAPTASRAAAVSRHDCAGLSRRGRSRRRRAARRAPVSITPPAASSAPGRPDPVPALTAKDRQQPSAGPSPNGYPRRRSFNLRADPRRGRPGLNRRPVRATCCRMARQAPGSCAEPGATARARLPVGGITSRSSRRPPTDG